jgi:flagellar protein FlaG
MTMNISSVSTTAGFSADTYGNSTPTKDAAVETIGSSKEGKASAPAEQKLPADLKRILDSLQKHNTRVERSVHEETHRIVYKIVNNETGDLIQEIPEEKLLDMAAKQMELNGILIDKKV